MLTSAAPMTVPATPKKEARTAADTAARAPATTWVTLSWVRGGFAAVSSGRSLVSVRGEVMGSDGSGPEDARTGRGPAQARRRAARRMDRHYDRRRGSAAPS